MRLLKSIKSCSSSIFAIAAASFLLVSAAHAECTFFTGWVDNKDGTVRDPRNGLVWKRCAEGYKFANGACTGVGKEVNLEEAKLMAQKSRFSGQSDWRLPSKEEFAAVMGTYDECKHNDWKNGEYAASKALVHSGDWFWSSSPMAGYPYGTWVVVFYDGDVSTNGGSGSGSYYARLVRAGQVLGGEADLEFVNEISQRAAKKERQHQIEQERERKKLNVFRKSLSEGDDTNCSSIIEVKGKLIKVAFAVANYGNEHWIKRDQILSPDYACRFVNGQYQSPQ